MQMSIVHEYVCVSDDRWHLDPPRIEDPPGASRSKPRGGSIRGGFFLFHVSIFMWRGGLYLEQASKPKGWVLLGGGIIRGGGFCSGGLHATKRKSPHQFDFFFAVQPVLPTSAATIVSAAHNARLRSDANAFWRGRAAATLWVLPWWIWSTSTAPAHAPATAAVLHLFEVSYIIQHFSICMWRDPADPPLPVAPPKVGHQPSQVGITLIASQLWTREALLLSQRQHQPMPVHQHQQHTHPHQHQHLQGSPMDKPKKGGRRDRGHDDSQAFPNLRRRPYEIPRWSFVCDVCFVSRVQDTLFRKCPMLCLVPVSWKNSGAWKPDAGRFRSLALHYSTMYLNSTRNRCENEKCVWSIFVELSFCNSRIFAVFFPQFPQSLFFPYFFFTFWGWNFTSFFLSGGNFGKHMHLGNTWFLWSIHQCSFFSVENFCFFASCVGCEPYCFENIFAPFQNPV